MPVQERHLPDEARTLLEAIDQRGELTAREAGEIVYRLRRWRVPRDPDWLKAAGFRVLGELRRERLVSRGHDGRWRRRGTGGNS